MKLCDAVLQKMRRSKIEMGLWHSGERKDNGKRVRLVRPKETDLQSDLKCLHSFLFSSSESNVARIIAAPRKKRQQRKEFSRNNSVMDISVNPGNCCGNI